ncbi:hypothetical protein AK830_g11405 [Neonectria ditissima]|uniref:Uncharacterized protein n=1 Tax=Neonectria ditissima TaxID=78410 RepID=A0A0P7B541_9HYPO|nr:hypothetical protein AK830_g11405 [Neonectria ditissima]
MTQANSQSQHRHLPVLNCNQSRRLGGPVLEASDARTGDLSTLSGAGGPAWTSDVTITSASLSLSLNPTSLIHTNVLGYMGGAHWAPKLPTLPRAACVQKTGLGWDVPQAILLKLRRLGLKVHRNEQMAVDTLGQIAAENGSRFTIATGGSGSPRTALPEVLVMDYPLPA